MSLEVHPQAIREARTARLWYKRRSPAAALGFVAELDRAIAAISSDAGIYPDYLHGTKRYLLDRYPFFVVYKLRETTVLIVAVAHARRRPGYWTRRI